MCSNNPSGRSIQRSRRVDHCHSTCPFGRTARPAAMAPWLRVCGRARAVVRASTAVACSGRATRSLASSRVRVGARHFARASCVHLDDDDDDGNDDEEDDEKAEAEEEEQPPLRVILTASESL